MSDLRPNNGGGLPPDDSGHRGGLPDLPPEWGSIVIPDDPAELEAEVIELRRELRREVWRARLARIGLGSARLDASSLGVPVVIMAVAVITTLLSLFVVTWDHRRNATAPVGPEAGLEQGNVAIAEVVLADATGARVRLGNLAPAILLLVGDCDCRALIQAVAAATPPPITVVPVGESAPCSFGTEKNVRCLADPAKMITGRYPTAKDVASASPGPLVAQPAGSPTVSASGGGASPSPTPPPMVLAVPVDADGNAGNPVLALSAGDLKDAVAALTAGN